MTVDPTGKDPLEEIAPGTRPDIAPDGAKTEEEIARNGDLPDEEGARIDPNSRIPRPVQPDLA